MARWRDGEMARWRDGEMARLELSHYQPSLNHQLINLSQFSLLFSVLLIPARTKPLFNYAILANLVVFLPKTH